MVINQPIYLNTASCGLVAPATLAAANKLYEGFDTNSSARSEEWRDVEQANIRQTIATFIGAPAGNIALIPNFSWALSAIVQSLKGTEKVLLYKGDYPSVIESFRINKYDITWVDAPDGFHIDIDAIAHAITHKQVEIVVLSHVQWNSGYKADLQQIGSLCRQHGVWFIVDATQSLGAVSIGLTTLPVDVLIASNYKWMNAAFGTGIMYMSDAFLAQYPPVIGGNNSYRLIDGQMQYAPGIQSYEPGHANMFGFTLLQAAINIKNGTGMAQIEAHNATLTQLLLGSLKDTPVKLLGSYTMQHRSSILVLRDEDSLGERLKQHNIIVTHRYDHLRVSMHFYNTADDVQALLTVVRELPVS